jgi:hypothetical protein
MPITLSYSLPSTTKLGLKNAKIQNPNKRTDEILKMKTPTIIANNPTQELVINNHKIYPPHLLLFKS